MKSLEPYDKKLGTDTWFYTKRCFLSLIENLAKHMIVLRDSVIAECVAFLESCECTSIMNIFLYGTFECDIFNKLPVTLLNLLCTKYY